MPLSRPRVGWLAAWCACAFFALIVSLLCEIDQPRLFRMPPHAEPREPAAQVSREPLGVLTMLKTRHVVVGEPLPREPSSDG
jgi:hypothetical protein